MRPNASFLINVSIIVCADDDCQSPWCCRHGRTDRRNPEIDDSTHGEQYCHLYMFYVLFYKSDKSLFIISN